MLNAELARALGELGKALEEGERAEPARAAAVEEADGMRREVGLLEIACEVMRGRVEGAVGAGVGAAAAAVDK